MKNSMFEDVLNSKAKSHKPYVNPNVYSGVKAGLNAGVKAGLSASGKMGMFKAFVAKVSYPVITKTVIGVISVASVVTSGYLLTSEEKNGEQALLVEEHQQKQEVENRIPTFTSVENRNQILEHSQSVYELMPCENRIDNFPEYHMISESNQNFCIDEIGQKESIFSLSHAQLDLKKSNTELQDLSGEQEKKYQLALQATYGAVFLLNNENNSSNEKDKGFSYGLELLAMYQISEETSLGVSTSFQELHMTTEYYSNGQKDGELKQDYEFINCNLNVAYQFLERKNWHLSSMLGGGISYKLKHKNSLSGKYFQNDFSYDYNDKDVLNYNLNLALHYHLKIKSNLTLKAGVQTRFYDLSKENQLLDCSGSVGIIYRW